MGAFLFVSKRHFDFVLKLFRSSTDSKLLKFCSTKIKNC